MKMYELMYRDKGERNYLKKMIKKFKCRESVLEYVKYFYHALSFSLEEIEKIFDSLHFMHLISYLYIYRIYSYPFFNSFQFFLFINILSQFLFKYIYIN